LACKPARASEAQQISDPLMDALKNSKQIEAPAVGFKSQTIKA